MGKKKSDKKAKSGKNKEPDALLVAELAPDITQAITQTARCMRTALSHNLLDTGLYAGQDGVILALAQEEGLTAGQLAAKLGVKPPTMTRTIGRMEAQGFVERRADAADGRLTKVHLTEAGLKTVEHIGRSVTDCGMLAIKGFSAKELRTLLKLLRAAEENLQRPAAAARKPGADLPKCDPQ